MALQCSVGQQIIVCLCQSLGSLIEKIEEKIAWEGDGRTDGQTSRRLERIGLRVEFFENIYI